MEDRHCMHVIRTLGLILCARRDHVNDSCHCRKVLDHGVGNKSRRELRTEVY